LEILLEFWLCMITTLDVLTVSLIHMLAVCLAPGTISVYLALLLFRRLVAVSFPIFGILFVSPFRVCPVLSMPLALCLHLPSVSLRIGSHFFLILSTIYCLCSPMFRVIDIPLTLLAVLAFLTPRMQFVKPSVIQPEG